MSQLQPDVVEVVETPAVIEVVYTPAPVIEVVTAAGPTGPAGQWLSLTQAEYNALDPPDPDTLYVIIG